MRSQHSTSSRHVATNSEEENPQPENIFLSDAIRHRLMLAQFSDKPPEPYWMPVRSVYPCPKCKHPVATIQLGRELKVVDCVENRFTSFYRQRWDGDVVGTHSCLAGGLQ